MDNNFNYDAKITERCTKMKTAENDYQLDKMYYRLLGYLDFLKDFMVIEDVVDYDKLEKRIVDSYGLNLILLEKKKAKAKEEPTVKVKKAVKKVV